MEYEEEFEEYFNSKKINLRSCPLSKVKHTKTGKVYYFCNNTRAMYDLYVEARKLRESIGEFKLTKTTGKMYQMFDLLEEL